MEQILRHVARVLLGGIATILAVSVLVFGAMHLIPGSFELPRYFICNDSPDALSAQQIRAFRLCSANFVDVIRGHFLDGRVRFSDAVAAPRFESVKRLIGVTRKIGRDPPWVS